MELSKALEVSIEKIQRAVELIHKEGIKGFGILEKELQVDSEQAERIYHRVKKIKAIEKKLGKKKNKRRDY